MQNHSWAQSYPHCYRSPDPADLELINGDEKVAVFLHAVREAKPAFAIPFANNVCFLHPQTLQYDDTAITPFDVAATFAEDDTPDAEPGPELLGARLLDPPGHSVRGPAGGLRERDPDRWGGLLSDAIDKNIVYLISISMRVSVTLSAGGVGVDLMFWAILAVSKLGYLPLRTSFNARTLGVAWRRRREFTDGLLPKLIGTGALVERMASNLKPDQVAADGSWRPPTRSVRPFLR